MSVDVIMYKIQSLTDDELRQICDTNVYDLDELNGWELKEFSVDETSLTRLEHIMQFVKPVSLMHTRTDYKACFIANGMPEDVKTYSSQHSNWGCIVHFNDQRIQVSREELDKFTTTKPKAYYVVKRKHIDSDVDGWIARTLMNELKEILDSNNDSDLSYTPIPLKLVSEQITRALVKMYDEDELYPNAELARFMLEIMRAMQNHDDDVFIEFQD